MMNVLIIEDELLAQQKLQTMLATIDNNITIQATLGSVKDTLTWLAHHPAPDLAFVDIQLSDDHCFEIFKKTTVEFPVIFTTAYDKYLLEALEFNSLDYLLKPITEEKLKRSLDKVSRLEMHFLKNRLKALVNNEAPVFLQRVIGKKGTDFIALDIHEVAYFYTEHKIVFVRDFQERSFIIDQNLMDMDKRLDSRYFFRVNRKYLCNIKSILSFKPVQGKILLKLRPETKEEIYVSKETAPHFRSWISGL